MIKHAVFPVAGLGTRFLPVTKASPKEMLTLIDKPLIHYAVQEAIDAGITQLIFITSANKRAIEDYFDTNAELEMRLRERGKWSLLASIENLLPPTVNCVFIRQKQPKGLGDAVLTARDVVGDHPFAVLLADDVLMSPTGPQTLQVMLAEQAKHQASVVAVEQISVKDSEKYGIVAPSSSAQRAQELSFVIKDIVEKPQPAKAPSTWGVVGRYVLMPQVFEALARQMPGAGGEIQLTDAIGQVLQEQSVRACPLLGRRYDCGSKAGYLEAILDFAARDPALRLVLEQYTLAQSDAEKGGV